MCHVKKLSKYKEVKKCSRYGKCSPHRDTLLNNASRMCHEMALCVTRTKLLYYDNKKKFLKKIIQKNIKILPPPMKKNEKKYKKNDFTQKKGEKKWKKTFQNNKVSKKKKKNFQNLGGNFTGTRSTLTSPLFLQKSPNFLCGDTTP